MTTDTVVYYNLRNDPVEHTPALTAARDLGLRVVLVAGPQCPAPPPGLVDRVHAMAAPFGPAAVEQGVRLAAEAGARGIVTWSDTDVVTIAEIAGRLGLPGPTVAAARLARDKHAGRAAMAAAAPDRIPRFHPVRTPQDVADAWDAIGPGGVLKPASGAGSAGVVRIGTRAEADAVAARLFGFARTQTHPLFADAPGELLYEEYLQGPEYSVEGFVSGGGVHLAAVTDKTTDTASFLEVQHEQPTALDAAAVRDVEALTANVVAAFGLDDCTFHLECKVSGGRSRLVEIAARTGGDYIGSHLVPAVTGTSFYGNVLRVATGRPPLPAEPAAGRYAAVTRIVAPRAGVYGGTPGLGKVRERPDVEFAVEHRPPGTRVAVPPDDYAGALLSTALLVAPGRGELRDAVAEVRELLAPDLR
ncbi:ATP-grasp domain-containing protein [Dactylosporangium sp. CA-139114]|uniref:ATP-grasp domain-containing protein n=1 Tax=Dactylosporangium sp. CA-139114 TaxID=3239931 RepID=UPI003D98E812